MFYGDATHILISRATFRTLVQGPVPPPDRLHDLQEEAEVGDEVEAPVPPEGAGPKPPLGEEEKLRIQPISELIQIPSRGSNQ